MKEEAIVIPSISRGYYTSYIRFPIRKKEVKINDPDIFTNIFYSVVDISIEHKKKLFTCRIGQYGTFQSINKPT